MKVGKPKSKRVSVRLRQKIQKASAAKQRKDKKTAKKNPEWRSKLKKDPGIPNLFPYKDKILHEIEESKRRKEEDVLRRREEARARRQGLKDGDDAVMVSAEPVDEDGDLLDFDEEELDQDEVMGDADSKNPMAALLASARARAADYDQESDGESMDEDNDDASFDGLDLETNDNPSASATPKDTSRRAYDKAFKEVISASDVVLYVIDARDPPGTSSKVTEQAVLASPDKRLILILNKIDLVPPPVLASWLSQLRRSFPTLPFRASASAPNARTFNHHHLTPQFTTSTLLKALKTFAGSRQLKRALTVGVIGYPNVGKSSVINALTSRLGNRKTTCPVGAEAGVTTSVREVKLDGSIKLLDSPGIVFPSSSSNASSKTDEYANLILLNAIPPRDITDPTPAVSLLLRRLSASEDLFKQLLETYGVPALLTKQGEDQTTDFLVHVARRRGRLGKGGVPNLHSAAQTVIGDWRDGRIRGWIEPPKNVGVGLPSEGVNVVAAPGAGDVGVRSGDEKKVVSAWAKEFKIEGLWGDDGVDIKA